MSIILKVPGLRILARLYEYINRPAPLEEFDDYDDYWATREADGLVARQLDRFKTIANLISDEDRVLDIGCGDGAFQQYLAKIRPHAISLGLDASDAAVQMAFQNGCDAQLYDPDVILKSQVNSGWDVVTLMELIEHLPEAENLMRQVMDLKPKKIFVTIPNVGCLKHRLRLLFGGRFTVTCIYYHMKEHLRFWTVEDFRQWADVLGLSVVGVYGQFDRGDSVVEWFVRRFPAMFADRVVYEMRLRG